jgi:hypothetical protein
MATNTDFKKHYQDTDFSKEELEQLNSKFLEFGNIWSISNGLIKRNLKRVFLFPALWQILIYLTPVIILVVFGIGAYLNLDPNVANNFNKVFEKRANPSLTQKNDFSSYGSGRGNYSFLDDASGLQSKTTQKDSATTDEETNYPDTTFDTPSSQKSILQLLYSFLGILALVCVLSLVATVAVALINFRKIYILNSKSIPSIWRTPRGFYIDLLKFIGSALILTLGSILVLVIAGVILNAINLGFLIILGFIAFIVAVQSLFGLFSFLIILEEAPLIESLQLSFNLMKSVFWKNLLRWLLVGLFYVGASISIPFTVFIISVILGAIFSSSGSTFAIIWTYIFTQILSFVLSLVANFIVASFLLAFTYVSFINIRFSQSKILAQGSDQNHDKPTKSLPVAEIKDTEKTLNFASDITITDKTEIAKNISEAKNSAIENPVKAE